MNISSISTLYKRNLSYIRSTESINKPQNLTTKEQAFNEVIEGATVFFANESKTGKEFVELCLNLHQGDVAADSNSSWQKTMCELGKNESSFFGAQTFPRGFQKSLAIGYVRDHGESAFVNGKFNYAGFKEWISSKFGKGVANCLKREYFDHITLDKNSNIKFGNTEYKNEVALTQILVDKTQEELFNSIKSEMETVNVNLSSESAKFKISNLHVDNDAPKPSNFSEIPKKFQEIIYDKQNTANAGIFVSSINMKELSNGNLIRINPDIKNRIEVDIISNNEFICNISYPINIINVDDDTQTTLGSMKYTININKDIFETAQPKSTKLEFNFNNGKRLIIQSPKEDGAYSEKTDTKSSRSSILDPLNTGFYETKVRSNSILHNSVMKETSSLNVSFHNLTWEETGGNTGILKNEACKIDIGVTVGGNIDQGGDIYPH